MSSATLAPTLWTVSAGPVAAGLADAEAVSFMDQVEEDELAV